MRRQDLLRPGAYGKTVVCTRLAKLIGERSHNVQLYVARPERLSSIAYERITKKIKKIKRSDIK